MARPILIDREAEVAELRALAGSGRKQLAIVYGRRQVGKTHLLSNVWNGERSFYFLAAALTPDLNRHDLLRDLEAWSGQPLEPADYPTWRTTFRALFALAQEKPLVVVLDEFQYLLAGGGDVTSQLVAVWDRLPPNLPVTLVLSGSEVSTMAHLQGGGEPLYGRVTWSAQLQPFDYRDAARMAPHLEPRAAACLYGVFGGMPRYLASVRDDERLADGIVRTILSPRGEVHLQMLTLLEQERGIRNPADDRAVLTAVAAGKTTLNDIVTTTGLEVHVARRALGILGNLGLVRGERNFAAGAKAAYRYAIADNAVSFWHHFVVPNRSYLAGGDPGALWTARVAPSLDSYMGRAFEGIVRQAYRRYHPAWGLPGVAEWGRWEGVDRDKQSVELDITARLADGRLLAGEIKWASAPVGPSVHAGVLTKLTRLAASGQGWARGADTAHFLYVAAAGFAPEMRALTTSDPRIRLVTLEDLYPA